MIVLLCIAFAIGGALFAIRLGDKGARLFGIAALGGIVLAMLPAVASEEPRQIVVSLFAAALGLAAFNRARAYRLHLLAEAARKVAAEQAEEQEHEASEGS